MKTLLPLAELLRPKNLGDFFGQEPIVGEGGWISATIASKHPVSVLFWGPPGCGKTTLAKIYMQSFQAQSVMFHPATHGLTDLKKLIKDRESFPLLATKPLILFVDEIHRWNRSQQDAFLPFLEDGSVTLVGATTENPSFSINGALLSRMRVITFSYLDEATLKQILLRALNQLSMAPLTDQVQDFIIKHASGDARYLLNMVETIFKVSPHEPVDLPTLEKLLQKKASIYDANKEQHYNMISALHKSIRGSDADAALYWLSRMILAGEDLHYIARRLVRIASEDIGLADPQAVQISINGWDSMKRLGSPEGDLALAEVCVYLALAPKSNAIYNAFKKAKTLAEKTSHLPPPEHIINAPTQLMKNLGYGKDYHYDHDTPNAFSGQNYFPKDLQRQSFYDPKECGFEREMIKRKEYFQALRNKMKQ
jgi:putative ATPase